MPGDNSATCLIAIGVRPPDEREKPPPGWTSVTGPGDDSSSGSRLTTDDTVVDARVIQAMRPGRDDLGIRWSWKPSSPVKLLALPSSKESARIAAALKTAREEDERAIAEAEAKGSEQPDLKASAVEHERPPAIKSELQQIDWWIWPCGPEAIDISVAVLHFRVDLSESQTRVKALEVFSPRWPGGRLRTLSSGEDSDSAPASETTDEGVDLAIYMKNFGLGLCAKESVTAWHLDWSHLDPADVDHADRVGVACGQRPASAHFAVSDRKLLLLRRDDTTPRSFLERVGISTDLAFTKQSYGSFRSLGAEALAYACAQRAGLDVFRQRFGQDLQSIGDADFRLRYQQWLQFRHRFPTEIHLESIHMNELYRAAAQQLGVAALAASVDEEHRLSMQLERDTSADATNQALHRLTLVTGGFTLLAVCITIADGARDGRGEAWHSYGLAAMFAAALVAIYVGISHTRPSKS